MCVESSAATVGQQIHTHNTTDNYDLHHISRSHTTFQVSTRHQQYQYQVLRYWNSIGIGIENTTSSGIGIGIESLTFQVLELVLVLKKMTSGIGIGIDLLL